ncbi:MAG: DUF362 domain-containing protein, partial [Eubacteriales bacterium]|nr:DUF362 domain-containing protein [Eubacteriales bacterium]
MVSHVLCDTYEEVAVVASVEKLLAPLGGMAAFVRPGQTVFIKPNMLGPAKPEVAKTTHPALIYAVAYLAAQAGGIVTVGDCPGGDAGEGYCRRALQVCGFEDAAQRAGARSVVCRRKRTVRLARTGFALEASADMLDADVLINVAKAKTHTYAGYTGAVKNLYGVIPGKLKAAYHALHPAAADFMEFVVDIAEQIRPALHIVDGIVGMEGPGPSAGFPRKLGVLAAGVNPHEVDWVMLGHMGWNPQEVATIAAALRRGLLSPDDIQTEGDRIAPPQTPFVRPGRNSTTLSLLRLILPHAAQRRIQLRPVIRRNCVGCGECARACPVS